MKLYCSTCISLLSNSTANCDNINTGNKYNKGDDKSCVLPYVGFRR